MNEVLIFSSLQNIGNYAFGYNEDHSTGGTFRREQGGPGHQVGSYGLRDADGRTRVVNYVADAHGFRANIQTNEPGVEPKDPAAVLINKAQAIVGMKYHSSCLSCETNHTLIIAPALAPAPLVAAPVAAPLVAPAVVAHAAPIATSSYSVSTQHVAAPAITYAAAAPVVSYAAAPLAAPVSYATKTLHAAPFAQQLVHAW